MQLQLALDMLSLPASLRLLEQVEGDIDIVEVGTPFIIRQGVRAVTEIKNVFPKLTVLADLKIVDAGEEESRIGVEAGADIVTVLAAADDETIRGAVRGADGGRVMVDMIGIEELERRAREVDALGVDYICVHTAHDRADVSTGPLSDLKRVQRVVPSARVAVAGGVGLDNIERIVAAAPDIIVVGGGITAASDPARTAKEIKERMRISDERRS